MATMSFDVPEDVKVGFNRAFARRDKSEVIANLMREAVARREALRRIEARQRRRPPISEARFRRARQTGRS